MADYDVVKAIEKIEKELLMSMVRNLDHHRAEEAKEGFEWSQWQVEQLKALQNYKLRNSRKYGTQFKEINKQIEALIYEAKLQGGMEQEIKILEEMKKGHLNRKPLQEEVAANVTSFRTNDRKIDSLIKATTHDFEKAEHAMLRRANDKYRKIIFNAQLYAATGGTYEQAVDMAIKDFCSAGIDCIEYSNGAKHTMKDYADMCIKTAVKRAYLAGEGEKRKEWGISLVIMNKRGNACPKCTPFVGKVMIDDVWSGGEPDGKHMLMSSAIAKGLYHPRCKDIHSTYFEGITTVEGEPYTDEEKEEIIKEYNQKQKANYYKRQAEQQQNLADLMLDKEDKRIHAERAKKWQEKANAISVKENGNEILEEPGKKSKSIKTLEKIATKLHNEVYDFEPITLDELSEKHANNIQLIIDNAPEDARRIIMEHYEEIHIISFNPRKRSHYSPSDKGIRINLKDAISSEKGSYTTLFHEIGHNIDHLLGNVSNNGKFGTLLKMDFYHLVNRMMEMYNCSKEDIYVELREMLRKNPKYHSVSDIIGALTNNECRGKYGHKLSYWKHPFSLEHEAFAHFFEAYVRNDTKKWEKLEIIFPNATQEFLRMLR